VKTKHTPGPWAVETADDGDSQCVISTDSLYGDCVAITRDLSQDFDTGEANALLIAAAPEILEALQRLADAVDSGNVGEQSLGALEAYRVIAKARGES
jgi:hypothetical protein